MFKSWRQSFMCREILPFWRSITFVFAPFLLCPLIAVYASTDIWREMNCAYTVALMAVYWVTEAIPIPVTALVPLVAFPLLSVETLSKTASPYLSASNFLFVGGLIIALAVEEVNLHRRLALKALLIVGDDPRLILLAFMSITWFLSMWMSNTATTAMMLPIALAVIKEVVRNRRSTSIQPKISKEHYVVMPPLTIIINPDEPNSGERDDSPPPRNLPKSPPRGNRVAPMSENLDPPISIVSTDDPGSHSNQIGEVDRGDPADSTTWSPSETRMAKAVLLSLCYSANIGGTATLTGTVPNVVALKNVKQYGLNYASWMANQFPAALVFLLVAYLWLVMFYFPNKDVIARVFRRNKGPEAPKANLQAVFRAQYATLGSFKFGEIVVLSLYIALVVLWIFRDPKFTAGWGSLFKSGYTGDAMPAIAISILLFAVPIELPDFYCCRKDRQQKPKLRRAVLTWKAMSRFPWDVILLLGGGFAMAHGVSASGLSDLLALKLTIKSISPAAFCALITTFMTFFTEVTSNTSTANIFVPILVGIAKSMEVHPYYYVIPVTVACSFAFMLPVATPPNAIVFGAGILQVKDMIIAGFALNCIGIGLALLNANYLMPAVFGIEIYNYTQSIVSQN